MFTEHPVEIRPVLLSRWITRGRVPSLKIRTRHYKDEEIFSNVLQAILLTFPGRARLGPVAIRGGIEQLPAGADIVLTRDLIMVLDIVIGTTDIPKLCIAYDLVVKAGRTDKTLGRALHRFILGRQRDDLADKLIDYIITWESILLTQRGNPSQRKSCPIDSL